MNKCALCGHEKDEHYSPIGCHHKDGESLCDCVWGSILEQRFRVIDDWVYYPLLIRREDYIFISATS